MNCTTNYPRQKCLVRWSAEALKIVRGNGILRPGPRTGGKEHGELSSRMGRIRPKAQEHGKTDSKYCSQEEMSWAPIKLG